MELARPIDPAITAGEKLVAAMQNLMSGVRRAPSDRE
jgi:hypothetical protein